MLDIERDSPMKGIMNQPFCKQSKGVPWTPAGQSHCPTLSQSPLSLVRWAPSRFCRLSLPPPLLQPSAKRVAWDSPKSNVCLIVFNQPVAVKGIL